MRKDENEDNDDGDEDVDDTILSQLNVFSE